ncbi:G patch domain and KOW motifs-containing protein [Habropoda laboriosa]|uniref:G patch domain and KOW motifs-containing protein n=1 Tax=Habropoda laboriosa TaxID=597456 RepID=A0A0L7R696_9HYME|nr:PREDICTED: G patch domain and KOW motifs-containing protein [Habropoda laboriosa]KOC66301.1 G patch domain and KOW motifs-containing protein [Habropoda laboriosa]
MAEEGKKISFGFAKSIKKPVLKNPVPQEEKKVDYIECLDEKGIKVIGEEEKKDEPLVIPLLGSKTWHDRIVNKIDADIFESKTNKEKTEETSDDQEEKPTLSNGNSLPETQKIKLEPVENIENKIVTLEEQAANEIIEDLKSKDKQETETKDLTLPLVEDQALRGKEQSTLEDYEKIPVDAFGVAMLRGMGWQPGKGIGKNEKMVSAVLPELRPKGMGLGADKVTLQKQNTDSKKQEEELKIEKGTFVKIIAGKQSNSYGQIEGFDDDAGRLIIKLALGGNAISVNEFMIQPVTKSEYSKNSKVLNAKKYEEYKDKESKELKQKESKKKKSSSEHSENSEDDKSNIEEKKEKIVSHDKNKHDKEDDKKSKSRKRHSDSDSNSDSDNGKKKRRGRSSSTSSESCRSKKSKKSKKHKKHAYSPERSSKKHKKKNKEKEKTRDKKSRDHTDRRKHKKHKRSRSRSSSRR